MTKYLKTTAIFALLLFVITACSEASVTDNDDTGKPLVYASFYPMHDFAKKAAGELAEVRCFIPDGTEPHDWEPTPKDIAELGKSDLFVYSGKGMEPWAESLLAGIKNKNLMAQDTSVYSSRAGGDAHTWLAPVDAKLQFVAICEALKIIDPENSYKYEENHVFWTKEFDRLDAEYSELRDLPQNKILVTHAAFGNLCNAYGLEQIAVTEGSPDLEPDPARMAEIISIAREYGVTTVFYEEIAGSKLAKTIADEIGGSIAPLSPLEGLTDEQRSNGDDYFSIMRKNLAVLREALS